MHRVLRGTIHVPHAAAAIIGLTQPGPLQANFASAMQGGISADGFMERFSMLIWPDAVIPQWTDRRPNAAAKERAFEVFCELAKLAEEAVSLHFDSAAQAKFIEWWEALAVRTHDPELPPYMAAHLSKYQRAVPSLALLFALADGRRDAVGLAHLKMAIHWVAYLETHARRVYSMVEPPSKSKARSLARRIQNGWKLAAREFTVREICRAQWGDISTADDARRAPAELEACGWVRKIQEQTTNGRPSERYQVNPAVTADFPDAAAIKGVLSGFGSCQVGTPKNKNRGIKKRGVYMTTDKTGQNPPPDGESAGFTGKPSKRASRAIHDKTLTKPPTDNPPPDSRPRKFTREGRALAAQAKGVLKK